MAKHKMLVDLDLDGNQIINGRWEVLEDHPANPALGRHYFNSVIKRPLYFDGVDWVDIFTLITSGNTPRTAYFENQTGTSLALPFPAATLPLENDRIRVYVEGFRLFPDRPGNPPIQVHWYRQQANPNELIFHRAFHGEWVMVEII